MGFLRSLLRGPDPPTATTAPAAGQLRSPDPPRLDVGWATDVGSIRDHNEDSVLVISAVQEGDDQQPPFGLFIVADGMGGHRAGEAASSLAARVSAHHITSRCYLPALLRTESDAYQPSLTEILVDAVLAANDAVYQQVRGGGTTLTCALVLGPQAYIAHVGDSRACLIDEARLEQITHDHTLVERLIENGQLTADEAANHPQQNVLYRAVGQGSQLEVDTHVRRIPPDNHLLLCSDGLWNVLGSAKITQLIQDTPSVQSACQSLVAAANRAGGPDNITVILWRSPSG